MPEKPIQTPHLDEETKKKAEIEARKKKEAELKKQAAKQPTPLYYFDIKVETMLPSTLTYRVLAEDAIQAADKIKHLQPNSVKYRLIGRRDQKLAVYDAGTTFIKYLKNLMGR